MKFNLFVRALEKKLGNHHIPVNRDAVLLQDLFANSPVHAEFVTNLIRTIYKKNNCQNLGSPIRQLPNLSPTRPWPNHGCQRFVPITRILIPSILSKTCAWLLLPFLKMTKTQNPQPQLQLLNRAKLLARTRHQM